MNAAIEAAHADEIRKLAETASAQSKSIRKYLTEVTRSIALLGGDSTEVQTGFRQIQTSVQAASTEMRDGNKETIQAVRSMNEVTHTVETIVRRFRV